MRVPRRPRTHVKPQSETFPLTSITQEQDAWREYLELQARLFAPAEFDLFRRSGLNSSLSSILDVGCGTGAYARLLKSAFPEIELTCVDSDESRLNEFRSYLQHLSFSGIKLVQWNVGEEPPPPTLTQFHGAVLRYSIQYAISPQIFLDAIRKLLRPGSPIFIVEEDDGFYQTHPRFNALEEFIEINRKWGQAYGSNRYLGREIPSLIVSAGLKVRNVEILCQSNFQVNASDLVRYFELALQIIASSSPSVLSLLHAKDLANQMKEFISSRESGFFFYYPQIITIAEVP